MVRGENAGAREAPSVMSIEYGQALVEARRLAVSGYGYDDILMRCRITEAEAKRIVWSVRLKIDKEGQR